MRVDVFESLFHPRKMKRLHILPSCFVCPSSTGYVANIGMYVQAVDALCKKGKKKMK